jgi:hypothetical protein
MALAAVHFVSLHLFQYPIEVKFVPKYELADLYTIRRLLLVMCKTHRILARL